MTKRIAEFVFITSLAFILPAIAYADTEEDQLVRVRKEGLTGYINSRGKVKIPFKYKSGQPFSEGLAAVKIGDRWGFINSKDDMVISPRFDSAGWFVDGLANVSTGDKCGYIDKTGSFKISPRFKGAWAFSCGVARIQVEEGWGFIDGAGKFVVPPGKYKIESDFAEGLAFVFYDNGLKQGYINKDAELEIKLNEISDASGIVKGKDFSEGVAAILIRGKWGYINKKGELLVDAKFHRCRPFSEGVAVVTQQELIEKNGHVLARNRAGFMDKNGEWVIPPKFGRALSFSNGVAPAWNPNVEAYGYIDHQGEWKIKPRFDRARPFEKGLARVKIDGDTAYINKSGELVWSEQQCKAPVQHPDVDVSKINSKLVKALRKWQKGKSKGKIAQQWEGAALVVGNYFEKWGEGLRQQGDTLNYKKIAKLLDNGDRPFVWKVAFWGYLKVCLDSPDARDLKEIGLDSDDIKKLKHNIRNLRPW